MNNIYILYLIFSILFLIERKAINILMNYIGITLVIAILIATSYNNIQDIEYISYILILVQISALTILFGFIIMLYPLQASTPSIWGFSVKENNIQGGADLKDLTLSSYKEGGIINKINFIPVNYTGWGKTLKGYCKILIILMSLLGIIFLINNNRLLFLEFLIPLLKEGYELISGLKTQIINTQRENLNLISSVINPTIGGEFPKSGESIKLLKQIGELLYTNNNIIIKLLVLTIILLIAIVALFFIIK